MRRPKGQFISRVILDRLVEGTAQLVRWGRNYVRARWIGAKR
ncbi:MAG: hypothetical protein V2A79_10055 [Planctomycetota bacterium]